jgi:mannitol operon repressor
MAELPAAALDAVEQAGSNKCPTRRSSGQARLRRACRLAGALDGMNMKETEPEVETLGRFLHEFTKESDRGAALVAASMLDERLKEVLEAYLITSKTSQELLSGFNAPLGTFSARASAAYVLGLIQENEFKEITVIRKIRNEFGHGWEPQSFESGSVASLCGQLPWLGPAEYEQGATARARFNAAVAILLTDLLWRVRLVSKERRVPRVWPHKARA